MNPQLLENLTKSKQSANLLKQDIQSAMRIAFEADPVLEVLLRERFAEAVELENNLAEIESCYL